MASDRNLFIPVHYLLVRWQSRALAAGLLKLFALPNTIRGLSWNERMTLFRYPFSKTAHCSFTKILVKYVQTNNF